MDLITQHIGELSAGNSYLLLGERGAGKTSFVLQFIYQGLVEHQPCILVSIQSPESLVSQAHALGMDLLPFLKSGTLKLYENVRKDLYRPADLYNEIDALVEEHPSGRLAIEGLGHSAAGPNASWPDGLPALFNTLKETRTTSFVTLESPVAAPLATLKEALENLSTGVFLLESATDHPVKTFSILKGHGDSANRPAFRFTVEPGRGITEAVKAKGIRFPRHDGH